MSLLRESCAIRSYNSLGADGFPKTMSKAELSLVLHRAIAKRPERPISVLPSLGLEPCAIDNCRGGERTAADPTIRRLTPDVKHGYIVVTVQNSASATAD